LVILTKVFLCAAQRSQLRWNFRCDSLCRGAARS